MTFRVAALLFVLAGSSAAAQAPWKASYFPYVIGNPADGAMLVARVQWTQNAPYFLSRTDAADVVNPISFAGTVSIEAGYGTSGSRFGRVEFRGPGLVKGWRFRAVAGAERRAKFGYYGLGGDILQADGTSDPNGDGYRVQRNRYFLGGEATKTISGPFRFALSATLDRTEFDQRMGQTLFRAEHPGNWHGTDFVVRPALVLDTRDREATPSKGVLLEAGAGFGTGRETITTADTKGLYGFGYFNFRGYVSPREGTVMAVRALVRTMEDAAPLSARYTVPGWERESGLAGWDGHRSFVEGALAGTDFELATFEVRHDLLNAGDLGAVTLVAFADYAHVSDNLAHFRNEANFWGGGGGVALRVLRSAHLSMNFAGGKYGFNFSMGTNWSF